MSTIGVRAAGSALHAVDPEGEEIIRSMAGREAMAKIWQPRSMKQNSYVHALLKIVADNHPSYSTIDSVKLHLKLRTGMFDPIVMPNGKLVYVPRKTDFWSMDQTEFSAMWESWRRVVVQELLPGIDNDRITQHILEML